MAPDLNKKLEDEVEKYRQTQNGKAPRDSSLRFSLLRIRYEEVRYATAAIIRDENGE